MIDLPRSQGNALKPGRSSNSLAKFQYCMHERSPWMLRRRAWSTTPNLSPDAPDALLRPEFRPTRQRWLLEIRWRFDGDSFFWRHLSLSPVETSRFDIRTLVLKGCVALFELFHQAQEQEIDPVQPEYRYSQSAGLSLHLLHQLL